MPTCPTDGEGNIQTIRRKSDYGWDEGKRAKLTEGGLGRSFLEQESNDEYNLKGKAQMTPSKKSDERMVAKKPL